MTEYSVLAFVRLFQAGCAGYQFGCWRHDGHAGVFMSLVIFYALMLQERR